MSPSSSPPFLPTSSPTSFDYDPTASPSILVDPLSASQRVLRPLYHEKQRGAGVDGRLPPSSPLQPQQAGGKRALPNTPPQASLQQTIRKDFRKERLCFWREDQEASSDVDVEESGDQAGARALQPELSMASHKSFLSSPARGLSLASASSPSHGPPTPQRRRRHSPPTSPFNSPLDSPSGGPPFLTPAPRSMLGAPLELTSGTKLKGASRARGAKALMDLDEGGDGRDVFGTKIVTPRVRKPKKRRSPRPGEVDWSGLVSKAIDNVETIFHLEESGIRRIPPVISDLANLVTIAPKHSLSHFESPVSSRSMAPSSSASAQASASGSAGTLPAKTRAFARSHSSTAPFEGTNAAGPALATSRPSVSFAPSQVASFGSRPFARAASSTAAFGTTGAPLPSNRSILAQTTSAPRAGLSRTSSAAEDDERVRDRSKIELYLGKNMLTCLPSALFEVKGLKALSLRHNQIERLPSAISELVNLKELNVACNNLRYLPSSIQDLKLDIIVLFPNPFLKPPPRRQRQAELAKSTASKFAEIEGFDDEDCPPRLLSKLRVRRGGVSSLEELAARRLLAPEVDPLEAATAFSRGHGARSSKSSISSMNSITRSFASVDPAMAMERPMLADITDAGDLRVSEALSLRLGAAVRSATKSWTDPSRSGRGRWAWEGRRGWDSEDSLSSGRDSEDEIDAALTGKRRRSPGSGEDAAENPWFNVCPAPHHLPPERPMFLNPVEERLEWVTTIGGCNVVGSSPPLRPADELDPTLSATEEDTATKTILPSGGRDGDDDMDWEEWLGDDVDEGSQRVPILWQGCSRGCLKWLEPVQPVDRKAFDPE